MFKSRARRLRDAITGPCEMGTTACTGRNVRTRPDPYTDEVDGTTWQVRMCDACEQSRADDA